MKGYKNKKDFEGWNTKKEILHQNKKSVYFRKKEIW